MKLDLDYYEGLANEAVDWRTADGVYTACPSIQTFNADVSADGGVPIVEITATELRALVAAARGQEWQDAATAPKNGDEIHVLWATHDGDQPINVQDIVWWDDKASDPLYPWADGEGYLHFHKDAFSHWRPLPPPPAEDKPNAD